MSMSLLAQYTVIAMAVLLSAGYLVQKQWPRAVRAARIRCAVPLLRDRRALWLQSLGRAIAPAPRVAPGACGTCNDCGTND